MSERKIAAGVYVHPSAVQTGKVSVGKGSSLWPHSVMRGDFDSITVGEFTSIQDCCVLHAAPGRPVQVGSYVTVGHAAVLHGCAVEDDCVIGINSVVLDGAKVGRGTIVAAGAVVKAGEQVPPNSFVAGVPGVVKPGKPNQAETNRMGAMSYYLLAKNCLEGQDTIGAGELFQKLAQKEKN